MTSYQGPATVDASGTEYPVVADLYVDTEGPFKVWRGTVTAADEGAAWEIFNDNHTKLRIDDRESGLMADTFNADTAELRVHGSGPAPFGP
ncbi:hypothetical protein ACFUG9_33980 [Streptomyces griseoincarnatus]